MPVVPAPPVVPAVPLPPASPPLPAFWPPPVPPRAQPPPVPVGDVMTSPLQPHAERHRAGRRDDCDPRSRRRSRHARSCAGHRRHDAVDSSTAPEFRQARSRCLTSGVLASIAMRTRSSKGGLAAALLVAATVGVLAPAVQTTNASADAGGDASAPCGDAAACTSGPGVSSGPAELRRCGLPAGSPTPALVPPDSSATPTCPGTGQPGCLAGCPATFSCEARPAVCADRRRRNCACAASLCAPGTCIGATGNKVACEGL